MGVLFRVHDDQFFTQSCCIAGIKSGIPLTVLFPEADNHNIRLLYESSCPDSVDFSSSTILPNILLLITQNSNADIIGSSMIGDRGIEVDRQVSRFSFFLYFISSVLMNFTR